MAKSEKSKVRPAEIVSSTAERTGLPKATVSAVLDAYRETLRAALLGGQVVDILNLVTLEVELRPERQGWIPVKGDYGTIEERNRVKAKVSRVLRLEVNGSKEAA
jgi:nucleoid DNA-binding protein